MTPPMTRPLGPFLLIVPAGIIFAIALPFGRRDDWVGTIAKVIVYAIAALLWTWLIYVWGMNAYDRWRRDHSDS